MAGRTHAGPICAAFECVCACRLSRAERSDLQLAVGGSGHGAEFMRGAPPVFEKGGRAAVASLFPAGTKARPAAWPAGSHFCLRANLARAELAEGPAFLAPGMPG